MLPIVTAHHERLNGLSPGNPGGGGCRRRPRLPATADVYHAMAEPRPYRPALPANRVAEILRNEVRAGRLDTNAVSTVLDVSGQRVFDLERAYGFTERGAVVFETLDTRHAGR